MIKGKKYHYLEERTKIKGKSIRTWQRYLGPADKIKEFYENNNGELDIKCIAMPRAGASHRELTDEVIIALTRVGDDKQTLHRRITDAYENLVFGRKH